MCHPQDPSFQLYLCVCQTTTWDIFRKCCRTIRISTSFGSMIFLKQVRPCFHCFRPLVGALKNSSFHGAAIPPSLVESPIAAPGVKLAPFECWANGVTRRTLWSLVDNSHGNPMGRFYIIYLHGLMFIVNVGKYMDVSKNRGVSPKIDGENNGKPY